jgi:propionaldehyde dehydrogenase
VSLDPSRIGAIVAEVLDRLERDPADPAASRPLGIHATLDEAVAAARRAFEAWRETPLEVRDRVIAAIRDTIHSSAEVLSKLAVEETGLGRVDDKILKNRLVGSEDAGHRGPGNGGVDGGPRAHAHGARALRRDRRSSRR